MNVMFVSDDKLTGEQIVKVLQDLILVVLKSEYKEYRPNKTSFVESDEDITIIMPNATLWETQPDQYLYHFTQ
jgi:hypothetical protein